MTISPIVAIQMEGVNLVAKMKQAVMNAGKSTFKFLMFISPVYPQCVK